MLLGSRRHPAVLVTIAYLTPRVSVPVMDRVDSDRPQSFIRVTRVGGPKLNMVTDGPMLTFDCWHPVSAEALACRVADIIEGSPGEMVPYVDDDGNAQTAWISSCEEVGGPVQLPDDQVPDCDRWTFTARLGIATNV